MTGFSGIGFVFAHNAPYVGIDLDDTHGDEKAFADQQHIYKEFDSYTELSPSGNGVHIIVKGKLPGPGRRRYFCELYDTDRYFTMTGNVINPRPIAERHNLNLTACMSIWALRRRSTPLARIKPKRNLIARLYAKPVLPQTVTSSCRF
jgi:hypothetical protein